MTTFLQDESSPESSQPREVFTIAINGVATYRHTSASQDQVVGGSVYTALAMDREEIAITMPDSEKEMKMTLPIDHPLVIRYCAAGSPPKRITVTVQRAQTGGEVETIWVGDVSSFSCDEGTASFLIPSRAGEWMLRAAGPSVGIECPWVLYSTRCGVDRNGSYLSLAHKVTATVITINGRQITIDLGDIARKGSWALGGEMSFAGESMTVLAQDDLAPYTLDSRSRLTLEAPLYGLTVGSSVTVYAGCDHTLAGEGGCSLRFGNRQAYGGAAYLPEKDIFVPGSYGPLQVVPT